MTDEKNTITPVNGRWIFLTVCVGVFMSTMDSSMVNVALPVLMKTFHSSLALTEWVVLIYLLTITMLLVFWGKLCNRWGCGNVYARGMLLFTIGSLLCGVADNIWLLILFRFIQALGASMMMATGPALIKLVFPAERLGRGFAAREGMLQLLLGLDAVALIVAVVRAGSGLPTPRGQHDGPVAQALFSAVG